MSNGLLQNLESNAIPLLVVALLVWIFLRSRTQALWAEAYRRLRRNKLAMAAVVLLTFAGTVALLDSLSWKSTNSAQSRTVLDQIFGRADERTYSAPMGSQTQELNPRRVASIHLLGTDSVGKDVLYQVLKGFRTAFIIGGFACLIAVPIALFFGMAAGFFGGFLDDVVQFFYTVFGSIPDILLIIALVLMLGKNLLSICFALGFTSWIPLCRLIRGETLKHRDREYVRAAKALGVATPRILAKHILPNLLPAIIISVTLLFSQLVLYESILAYLGVGVGSDTGSWGNMIDAARDELTRDPAVWWPLVSAASALLVLVLSLNILADALRDAIDPRLRTE